MKKLIIFLGTSKYDPTKYIISEQENIVSRNTRFIQEAIIEKIERNLSESEEVKVYICLTEAAKSANWIEYNRNNIKYDGLKRNLDESNINYEVINIKDGRTEDEIWENFNLISDKMDKGDTIYLDVTHSFRSIPIMMMSILNYAKFTRNIKIGGIYYGAYDNKNSGETPIFDLTLFDTVTDWSIGARNILETGNSDELYRSIDKYLEDKKEILAGKSGESQEEINFNRKISELKDRIKKFTEDLQANRGKELYSSAEQLRKTLSALKNIDYETYEIKPLENILGTIYNMVEKATTNEVLNTHNITKLTRELDMVQSSYTFLRENIINFLVEKSQVEDLLECNICHNIREDLGRYLENKYGKRNIPYRKEVIKEKEEVIDDNLSLYVTDDLYKLYIDIRNMRNDINHSGYREDDSKSKVIFKNLSNLIGRFEKTVIEKWYIWEVQYEG